MIQLSGTWAKIQIMSQVRLFLNRGLETGLWSCLYDIGVVGIMVFMPFKKP